MNEPLTFAFGSTNVCVRFASNPACQLCIPIPIYEMIREQFRAEGFEAAKQAAIAAVGKKP